MEIKVLGTGCASCITLYDTVKRAVEELELEAKVEKVEDLMQIMEYNVMRTPALVINNKVVSSGVKLSISQVKDLLIK